MKGKKASMMDLPTNLLLLFIVITFFVALVPGFVEILDMAQRSDYLNCAGYVDYASQSTTNYSFNATLGTKSTIACLAIKLYLPYIALAVLIACVGYLFARGQSQQPMDYGGGY